MSNILLSFIPELLLILIIIAGQVFDIFKWLRPKIITLLSFFALLIALICSEVFASYDNLRNLYIISSSPNLVVSSYIYYFKSIILALLSLIMLTCYGYYYINYQRLSFEYITIILIAGLGAIISIYAQDFLILFLSLEMQMIASYLLVAFRRDNLHATAASIKYFILGSCTTCFMLFGISFIYGFAGSINYAAISEILQSNNSVGLNIGLALVMLAIFFKLGAAPLHLWVIDVYEGSNILTLLFFTLISKITGIAILYNIMKINPELAKSMIMIFAVSSMLVGSIGGLRQSNIKRLLAYSGILSVGFALLPAVITTEGLQISVNYLLVYGLSVTAFIVILISTNRHNIEDITFSNIASLGIKHKYSGMALSILVFSMIGIPPFAGFFIKYSVISLLIANGQYYLSALALLCTLISAFYYLRIIKILYFVNRPNLSTKFFISKIHQITAILIVFYIVAYSLF